MTETKPNEYTAEQLAAIRSEYAKGSTDTQFTNFIRECQERKLTPGRHVYFQLRKAREWSEEARAYEFVKKASYQTSIDAFRLIAQRSGEYRGQDAPLYFYLNDEGEPAVQSDIQLSGGNGKPLQPWAVRVGVYRKGFEKPIQVTARFEAYAVYIKNRQDKWVLNNMWERRGPEQLEKCAEALALRKAFPEELGGIYIAEELPDETPEEMHTTTQQKETATTQPVLAATPAVNHTPAEGKEEPRPPDKTKRRNKSAKADISENQRTETSSPECQSGDTTGAAPETQETPAQGENPAPAPTPSEAPLTKEERAKFIERLKTYARTILPAHNIQDGSESLQNYIMGFFGKPARELGRAEFEQLLADLDKAADSGGNELYKLVKGEYPK